MVGFKQVSNLRPIAPIQGRNFSSGQGQDISSSVLTLTSISNATFQEWLETGQSLEPKYHYPSVILLPDDTVIKIWAKKAGLFSSGRWNPYSSRFVKHALALRALDIPVPEIIIHGQLEGTHVRLVRYHSIPGKSVRSILHSHPEELDIPALAQFYKRLHDRGVNFKGGHLGNIIQIAPGEFGLIDFTSMRIFPRPLDQEERLRNLDRPLSYEEDIRAMKEANLPDLLESYSALS